VLSLLAFPAQKYLQKYKYWLILKPAHAGAQQLLLLATPLGACLLSLLALLVQKYKILTQKGGTGRAAGAAAAAAAARKRRWAHAVVEVLR
jgi:hypothetical protein